MNLSCQLLNNLTEVNEIGPKIASSIIAYFSDKDNLEMIDKLKSAGIRFSDGNGNNHSKAIHLREKL